MRLPSQAVARNAWTAVTSMMEGIIPVTKYVSDKSNMSVAIADVEGPIVSCRIGFATETTDNDGLPHTLEHLVFMGSDRFPYLGILDVMANRCLASGTNGETNIDNTVYELDTVGHCGLLKMLPVYLNHLLFPLLTDEQFETEVHHIDGEGEDGGVVYCEMQDYESDMDTMINWAIKDYLYPKGCAYSVDYGGRLKNLRDSCNNIKVRQYHKRFYNPRNMIVIVCGQVSHNEILSTVELIEMDFLKDTERCGIVKDFARPFTTKFEKVEESMCHTIFCPSDDLSSGTVQISWHGPDANDMENEISLNVLFRYLSESVASPLQKHFVQLIDPFCTSADFYYDEQSISEIGLTFSDVPCEKLHSIRPRFFDLIISNQMKSGSFDMERMRFVINQLIRLSLSALEMQPVDAVTDRVLQNFLYGNTHDQFDKRLNNVEIYERLIEKEESFWTDLVTKYLSPTLPHVCVIGQPSSEMVEKVANDEEKRLDEQREKLGAKGLQRCAQSLQNAIQKNKANEPSQELLDAYIVDKFDGFNEFAVIDSSNLLEDNYASKNWFNSLPFGVNVHDCKSQFIEATVALDTSNLDDALRPWIMLWLELMFESPAYVDGKWMSYEQVAVNYCRDLVTKSCELGIGKTSGVFDRLITVSVKVDRKSYAMTAKWLKIFLTGIQFDAERIAVCAQKLANEAVSEKRDAANVASTLLDFNLYTPGSNPSVYDIIRLEKFHQSVADKVKTSPNEIIAILEDLRQKVACRDNMILHISMDQAEIENSFGQCLDTVWKDFTNSANNGLKRLRLDGSNRMKEPLFLHDNGFGRATVATVGSSESSFLLRKSKFICNYLDANLATVLLYIQYLSQCEGPLWKEIRGSGLAYNAGITASLDRGSIELELSRSTQLVDAYEQTVKLLKEINSGSALLDRNQFEAAKRSLINQIVSREDTLSKACEQATLAYYRHVPLDFKQRLCQCIWNAKMDALVAVGAEHIDRLLDHRNSITSVVCHPNKLEEVRSGFEKLGRPLDLVSLDDSAFSIPFS